MFVSNYSVKKVLYQMSVLRIEWFNSQSNCSKYQEDLTFIGNVVTLSISPRPRLNSQLISTLFVSFLCFSLFELFEKCMLHIRHVGRPTYLSVRRVIREGENIRKKFFPSNDRLTIHLFKRWLIFTQPCRKLLLSKRASKTDF